ncbi:adenylate/guanylate cyclase domain-containing protein [Pannonibacter tanglangensis]|uniref:CHASE2 domain-containing protein n=1 Tax=Pannonibacter tanglangensis TaxID=2750084 RepID=A0ABW9ZFL5_9HYPH|nr:adenylate/guanylate cyclase domain-containing protein [Pannonibacter sp. XCT-34]NBN62451.1 CHASE2 domain-containing protein [Pannonibacter sp. XCT-34]
MSEAARAASAASERRRLKAAVIVIAVIAGVLAGVGAIRALWEGWIGDRLLQVRAMVTELPQDRFPVAVVGLDQASLSSRRLEAIPRVFMSQAFAKAGDALFEAGATAIGLDFVFAFSADAFADPQTGEARLRGYDRLFLRFLYENRGRVVVARTSTGVPHRSISAAAGSEGVRSTEILTDNDGVVRRHQPQLPLNTSPAFVDTMLGLAGAEVTTTYMPMPGARLATSIPYLSLLDVLDLMDRPDGAERLREFASGRVILFGSTLPNEDEHLYLDRFLPRETPAGEIEGASGRPPVRTATSGVFILADLIGSPLVDRTVAEAPLALVGGLIVVFALVGALAGLSLPLPVLPLVVLGLLATGFGLAFGVLMAGWTLPAGAAPTAGFIALMVAGVAQVAVLKRRERELVRLFGHYLSPQVIRTMAEEERLSDLGGETRKVVVAFIDIVGFTRMSERLPDREVVKVVNTVFDAIGTEITRSEGYIDKYIGDAVMAVWNAPNDVTDPEARAVGCALAVIDLLPELRRRTGQAGLDLRIALNAGPALVGDIGGETRRSFTVMGTTVNTASRIEGIAKEAGVRLAFTGPVAEALPADWAQRLLWRGQLRGLSTETVVHTLDDGRLWLDGSGPALSLVPEDAEPEDRDPTSDVAGLVPAARARLQPGAR